MQEGLELCDFLDYSFFVPWQKNDCIMADAVSSVCVSGIYISYLFFE